METTKAKNWMDKKPVKILVVDDREDNLLSIETILEKNDYNIVKASSGRAALKILLHQHDFTLILMDVQMPDMNGFETASLIYQRDKLKNIPIIFITAHNHGEEKMYEGYKTGGVDYIYKPVNAELLRYKVGVFVELYQKTHQLINQEKNLLSANKKLESEIEERKISEEKIRLLNQQLLSKNEQLTKTIEDLDRFAYVASHDLQEPLRKILVFSDKILTRYKNHIDEELNKSLVKIMKASERMQLLINDLLKFSRHPGSADDFTTVDVKEIIEEVRADMEIDIEKHGAKLCVADLPQILAIPSQMRQLFQNLLSNALKFKRSNVPPEIRIYAAAANVAAENGTAPGRQLCRIVVQDNGIGFDEKFASEIFMVFKRLHSYHEFEGSGVGLSICKKIVDSHKGFISVKSKIGEGSQFYIDLPVFQLKECEALPMHNT